MKKTILLLLIMIPMLLFSQTPNLVPDAAHEGTVGTLVKPWLMIYADGYYGLGSMAWADSSLWLLKISEAGGGTVMSVATGNGLTGGTITSSGTLSIDTTRKATAAITGFLGYTDWVLFNSKQASLGYTPGSMARLDSTMSRDTAYSNSVSKIAGADGILITKNSKDYTIKADTTFYITKWDTAGFGGGGGGTVTDLSVVTANGISGSVATSTTTPAITLTLGAITPSTVNGFTLKNGAGVDTIEFSGRHFVKVDSNTTANPITLSHAITNYSPIAGSSSLTTFSLGAFGNMALKDSVIFKNALALLYAPISVVGTVTSVTIGNGLSGSSPITSTGTVSLDTTFKATAALTGLLSYADWVLFNGKQASGDYMIHSDTTTSVAMQWELNGKFNTADTTAFNSKTLTTAQLAGKIPYSDTTTSIAMQWELDGKLATRTFGTMANVDSVNFKGGILKNADTTTVKTGLIAKADSSSAPNGAKYITGTMLALKANSSALNGQIISFTLDSSWINVTDTIWVDLPENTLTVDSISVSPVSTAGGTAVSLVPKFLYRTAPYQTCTAIINSPATITSSIAKTWQSTIDNATLPANGQVGVLHTTVTTKPKQECIGIKVNR
ncbi:MAG: hypothetical protein IMZ53_12905 [Thermoplasmata archaeon]|nr:hypothetical protein [Thermoplasmata archaeon]